VVAALGCAVLAPAPGGCFEIRHDQSLREGDVVELGRESFAVLHLPGHTDDHLALVGRTHLISGDLIFAGGCGHTRFGGDAGGLYRSFVRLAALPGDLIYLPGHDYARQNLPFVRWLLPGAVEAYARLEAASQRSVNDVPRLVSLREEAVCNPFLRHDDPEVAAAVEAKCGRWLDPDVADAKERRFRALRKARDEFGRTA
jgi:hydroxyacylglutathione hydrolase